MNRENGFTLIEILVSLVVFAMVMAVMGGAFYKLSKDWQRQRDYNLVLENARWAIEFMSNEIRTAHGDGTVSDAGESPLNDHELLHFELDSSGHGSSPDKEVYYWRGRSTLGQPYVLYRGQVNTAGPVKHVTDAMNVAQELCRFVVNGTDIFNVHNCTVSNCTVDVSLTVRPRPDLAIGPGNQNYTFRTTIRPRN